jgi:ABC-type spermidine/putrescine transport system permease subunit II
MRRRVIGAALTILGVLVLLFLPIAGVGGCSLGIEGSDAGGCYGYSTDWWGLIRWSQGWAHNLTLPMLITGVALVVTGIVLLVKPRRSSDSPSTAR